MLTAGRAFWVVWALVLGLKLWLALTMPLFGDEAWYWLESRHLAAAYSDVPALTAWMIRAGTLLAGDTPMGVRLPFLAIGMLLPFLVADFAGRWFGESARWRAGILALLLPLLGTLGVLALPDVPLTLAAMMCLAGAAGVRERVNWADVLLLAAGLVVGALSHYRFVLLIAAGAIGLFSDARGRAALRDPRVWLALVLGALAWVPLLVWNLTHGNAGVAFQLHDRHPWSLHGGGFAFLVSQCVLLGPLLFVFAAAALHARQQWRAQHEGPWALLLWSTLVPVLVYGLLAFVADRERVSFHWLLQAWLPMLAVAPLVLARWPAVVRVLVYVGAVLLLCATFLAMFAMASPTWRATLSDSRWYPDNFAGWDSIATELRARNDTAPLLADDFMLGAQLAFALRQPHIAVLDHPLNHAHGRAAQLAAWGATPDANVLRTGAWTLVMEDSALPMRERLAHYHARCEDVGALPAPASINVDHGRKRFLVFPLAEARPLSPCTTPAMSWIDTPAIGETVATTFDVQGWAFKDGVGLAHVEVLLDGVVVAQAGYGVPMPNVAAYWQGTTDPMHPNVGFVTRVGGIALGEHWLALRLHGQDGSIEDGPAQRIVVDDRPVEQRDGMR